MVRFAVAVLLLASGSVACAETPIGSPPHLLVVGRAPPLAEAFARLAGAACHIERLDLSSTKLDTYDDWNRHALRAKRAVACVRVAGEEDDTSEFWARRLESQGAKLVTLRADGCVQRDERLLRVAHAILIELFPEHRPRLDAQLRFELNRAEYAPSQLANVPGP